MKITESLYESQFALSCVENHTIAFIKSLGYASQLVYYKSYVSLTDAITYFYENHKSYSYFDGFKRLAKISEELNLLNYESKQLSVDELDFFMQSIDLVKITVLVMADMEKCEDFKYKITTQRDDHFLCITDYEYGKYTLIDDITKQQITIDKAQLKKFYLNEIIIITENAMFSLKYYFGEVKKELKRICNTDFNQNNLLSLCPRNMEDLSYFRDGIGVLRVSRKRMKASLAYLQESSILKISNEVFSVLDTQITLLDKFYSTLEYMRIRKSIKKEKIYLAIQEFNVLDQSWIGYISEKAFDNCIEEQEFICTEIVERRSYRVFDSSIKISDKMIYHLIKAASLAPSGKNIQPWRFKILRDEDLFGKIAFILKKNRWLVHADCLIAIFLDGNIQYDTLKSAMSIGAAIENMLLEAQANNIAACWIGECTEYQAEISEIISVESSCILLAIIALGGMTKNLQRIPRMQLEHLIIE